MHIVFASTDDNDWASLNGAGWRTLINPDITYMVSTVGQLGASSYRTAFGYGGAPHLVMVGKNRILKTVHAGWGSSLGNVMRQELLQYIAEFDFSTDHPVADQTLNPGESKTVDLSSVFSSSHGTPVVELAENSNSNKVTAVLNGTQLTITAGAAFGFTNIKIKGTAGQFSGTDEFTVEVLDPAATALVTEGFEGTWPPAGWTNEGLPAVGTYQKWRSDTKLKHSGTKSAGAHYKHTGNVYLTSPVLDVAKGGLLEFWWRDDDITAKVSPTDSTFCEISKDGGATWKIVATLSAAGNESVFSKVMVDLKEYAGTNTKVRFRDWSNGSDNAWGTAVDDVRIVAYSQVGIENSPLSADFTLEQNYPNPFNPSTSILFTLKSDADVTLTVYNQAGEEVSVLASGRLTQGSHNVQFDGSSLNSGVYFYTLKAGNQEKTGKMLLIK